MDDNLYDMLKGYLLSIDQKEKKNREAIQRLEVHLAKNDGVAIWKQISMIVIGILIGVFGAVWRIGVDTPDRKEVEKMINNAHFPYLTDKDYILSNIRELKEDTNDIKRIFWKYDGRQE